ncbi:peptidyl-alpha-hydroxyglycine alpha-amidating lyase family protein [Qipengyuania vesicularis]|uniref:peptidyl-alpha-hydroxyglycine alpha-amidating lyase family protein n=1 Tax=Qipengyuania vesicularis TaxID=2867232 RepID=UPI001C883A58|nr:peptidyl-alpha-hydroxyglycine alpha-amidating lyase family protein [Qipengyuania vesicularis]MBX7527235.1 peptidyl-alpha-hydroxyglycine alpha-amidating lyase family protein [Qipengyuania vesicularis]
MMIGHSVRGLAVSAIALALIGCGAPAPREAPPKAQIDENWPTIPADAIFGQVSAVEVDSHGHIFVLHRAGREWEEPFTTEPIAEPTVFMFDTDGELLAQWGAGTFVMPHGLSVDADDAVWITDVAREQVFRFSHDGEEQLVIGERGVGAQDERHFGRPADVAFLGDRVLVADGYVNTRVAEFDRSGAFLREWGDFSIAHGIAVDEERIYVADRENARIQVFAHDGTLLESRASKTGNHTYGLAALGGGRLAAVEGRDGEDRTGTIIRVYAADGTVERSLDIGLGGEGASLGHDIAVDREGNAYVTDVYGNRVVRFALENEGR